MPIVFTCAACGKSWSAEDRFAGTTTACANPACGRPVTIPRPGTTVPVRPPAPVAVPGAMKVVPVKSPTPKVRPVNPIPETPSNGGGRMALVLFLLVLLLGGGVAAAVVALRWDTLFTPTSPINREKDKDGKDKDGKGTDPVRPGLSPPSDQWRGHLAPILALGPTAARDGLWSASGGLEDDRGTRRPFRDSTLRAWSVPGREVKRLDAFDRGFTSAAISFDGRFAALVVAAGGAPGEIALVDLVSGSIRALTENKSAVGAVCFTADGRHLLAAGEDGRVLMLDVASGSVKRALSSPSPLTAVAASPDGQWVVGGMKKAVRVWDANTGERKTDITTLDSPVVAVAVSPDSRTAVFSGRADHDIVHHDIATGKERGRFTGHLRPVTALHFDPAGTRLLSGSDDGQVRIWDADTRRQSALFTSQTRPVRAFAVLPDGRQAVAAGDQAALRVLNLPAAVADAAKDIRAEDVVKRRAAAAALLKDPDRALAARSDLLVALGRKGCPVRDDVVRILEKQGVLPAEHADALPALLADTDFPRGRRYALNQVRELGTKARPAAKAVVALFDDADPEIRREALSAGTAIASMLGPTGFKSVMRALADPDREIRAAAEAVVERMPTPAVEQLPDIKPLLTAKQAAVRLFALKAIAAMGTDAAEAVEVIAKAMGDPSEDVRVTALGCLSKIAPKHAKTLEAARRGLDDANPDILRESARLLAAAGDVVGLLAAAGNKDADVSRLATESLEKAAFAKEHVPSLLGLLSSRREAARKAAMLALGALGADASAAVDPLVKMLPAAQENEQKAILLTLAKLGPGASKAAKAAGDLLTSRNRDVRLYAAALVITTKGEDSVKAAKVLIPELLPKTPEDLTSDVHAKDRQRIRELLVSMGKDAAPLVYQKLDGDWYPARRDPAKYIGRLELYRVLTALGPEADTGDVVKLLTARQGNEVGDEMKGAARAAYSAVVNKKD